MQGEPEATRALPATLGVTAQPQPSGNSSQECSGWLPTPIPNLPQPKPTPGTRGLTPQGPGTAPTPWAPRGRQPQKPEKRAPSGTFLQKMSDPPTPPAWKNERKRGKKSCFWWKKATKKQHERSCWSHTRVLHINASIMASTGC